MKSNGIVRNVDQLGRVVLPVELRRMLNIAVKDPVEISVNNQRIVIQKYSPCCVFCGKDKHVEAFKDKLICAACRKELQETK